MLCLACTVSVSYLVLVFRMDLSINPCNERYQPLHVLGVYLGTFFDRVLNKSLRLLIFDDWEDLREWS